MSATSARINTLRALVAGAQSRTGTSAFNDIDQEIQEVGWCNRVSPIRRRHLLQVFHGLRALESALKEVIRSHGFVPGMTLGEVLHQLNRFPPTHPAHLDASSLNRFLRSVKDERNRLMHNANVFPRSTREAERAFGEISACFTLLVK